MNITKKTLPLEKEFIKIIKNDVWMIAILKIVRDLKLNDCWIGAGFVRNKIWDKKHGKERTPLTDIDIIYFDKVRSIKKYDTQIERRLKLITPNLNWSVKNQARMNLKNGHKQYANCTDAISFWPETATSIAIRLSSKNQIEYIAPYGLEDLFNLLVIPTPKFDLVTYTNRVEKKRWKEKWNKLEIKTDYNHKIEAQMAKTLYDLTKEDWNTLFPIELVDHNPEWKKTYENEKNRILDKVGKEKIIRIEHFGSSSITAIKSKPYIDLMIEIPKELLFDEKLINEFTELGYSHFKVPTRENIAEYSTFGKGYNVDGTKEQIFHIHMCPKENAMWKQIDFRDFLNSNSERAKKYEKLKIELATKFKNDRGSYVLGKTDFVNETLDMINKKGKVKQDI